MRVSRMTDEQLEAEALRYRRMAATVENMHPYRERNECWAEIIEELLDHREEVRRRIM